MISLVEALDDPQLLGSSLTPFPRQRELLAEIEAGPRIAILALGRRSGKTTMMALLAIANLLLRPDLDGMVRPGEARYALAVAVNQRQARLLLAAAKSIVEQSPVLAPLLESSTEDELRFSGRRILAALPCSSRGVRGWPVSGLFLDEYAHFLGEEGPAAADRVWEALMPSTAQFGDAARIVVASTPAGHANSFARIFFLAEQGELPDAQSWTAPTAEMNPTISASFLASERARDPVSFSSEFEARFVGGSGAFFDEDLIEACVSREDELDPRDASEWVGGLDPGVWRDPFGLAIVGRDRDDSSRLVLGVARSWAPPKKKPALATGRRALEARLLGEVGDVLTRYGVSRAVTDSHLGPAVDEELNRRSIYPERVTLSGGLRLEVFSSLRQAMAGGRLSLYRHEGLVSELARVRTVYRAGQLSVELPRTASNHLDLAVSLALAVWALDRDGPAGRGQPFLVDVSEPTPLFGLAETRRGRPTTTAGLRDRIF